MRRLLAVLLLAAFGLPIAVQASALTESPDANLPACCRRGGMHHCAMMMALMAREKGPSVYAVCPHFPQSATPAPTTATFGLIVPPATHTVAQRIAIIAPQQAETARLIARHRANHKRGPPTLSL
jgi:hypothetical protein